MKEYINLGLECFDFCPISRSLVTIAANLLMMLCSQRCTGFAGGARKISTDMNWFNLLMLESNPSVNQLQLSMSLMVSGGILGMLIAALKKFSS